MTYYIYNAPLSTLQILGMCRLIYTVQTAQRAHRVDLREYLRVIQGVVLREYLKSNSKCSPE